MQVYLRLISKSMTEFWHITQRVFQGIWDFVGLKFVPAVVIPLFGFLFGMNNSQIVQAVIVLIVFDFFTGVFSAYHSGEVIKSKAAVRSAFKVAVYGLLISAGHLTDSISPFPSFIQDAVATFLALTELISIIENVGKMGFAIPKKLLHKLEKLRDEETVISEKTIIKEKTNPNDGTVEKHTITETKTEAHVSEKLPEVNTPTE